MARQLPGKEKKESKQDKLRRRESIRQSQEQVFTVAVPVLVGILALVFLILWLKSSSTADLSA
eukprot:CAMPEP_0114613426 /NCGR_PEP_ID=MMETSP0168-20121206/5126_1 /TAXON_ID=95228 ORGANISM="Vannella sp., Strain DIVA3 517/6/12" /NCGR_SAMPLE_ID=MMETSP0168 /ASSEMBLY_ACC=CAM_ASM_000044 /LENGTH=62 /DNA_ID=CAMNT_0001824431 /DNA_START=38 /DNA_END=226 /DNA_ORIENTATION=+